MAPANPAKGPAVIRIQKELSELCLPPHVVLTAEDCKDLLRMKFSVDASAISRIYSGTFTFLLVFPSEYPFRPPKLRSEPPLFHPNIDWETGSVCMNILREDWNPVISIDSIINGVLMLLMSPNVEDPVNKEAAALLMSLGELGFSAQYGHKTKEAP